MTGSRLMTCTRFFRFFKFWRSFSDLLRCCKIGGSFSVLHCERKSDIVFMFKHSSFIYFRLNGWRVSVADFHIVIIVV